MDITKYQYFKKTKKVSEHDVLKYKKVSLHVLILKKKVSLPCACCQYKIIKLTSVPITTNIR